MNNKRQILGTILIDHLIALVAGGVVLALLFAWPFSGLHPCCWTEVAVGSGLVPPRDMLCGLGNLLSRLVFGSFSFTTALTVGTAFAKVLVAACVVLAFWVFVGGLDLLSANGARDFRRRYVAVRMAAFVGAVTFGCSDPMWQAAQGLTGSTVTMFLVVLALNRLVKFLTTARLLPILAALFTGGLICAETPVGALVVLLGLAVTVRYLKVTENELWKPFLESESIQRTKTVFLLVFVAAVVFGIVLEFVSFAALGGLRVGTLAPQSLPARFWSGYARFFVSSMSVSGLILFLLLAVAPFVLAALLVLRSTDEDNYLPLKLTCVFLSTSLVSFLQLSPYDMTWFWNILPGAVASKGVVELGALLSASTLAMGVFVLGIEMLCRDYGHVDEMMYHLFDDDPQSADPADETVVSVRLTFSRMAVLALPALSLAIVIHGRPLADDHALFDVIRDCVRETVDEARGTRHLVTDGSMDDALRIESRSRGIALHPISPFAGDTPYDAALRRRAMTTMADRLAFGRDVTSALRNWVCYQPERMPEVSAQVAFELFGANTNLTPVAYGLLVRPAGDAAAAAAAAQRARGLAERFLALHESGRWGKVKSRLLKELSLMLQFRLATMCRLRATEQDARGDAVQAQAESALAEKLNAANPALCEVLERQEWVRHQSGAELTQREGLEIALRRADFQMARRYALPLLKDFPDDPDANFALGMGYYVMDQLSRAETHLRTVLKTCPDDAAACNNLALVCLRTQRPDEAERLARKAAELSPDSAEAKDTLRRIESVKSGRERRLKQ